MENYYCISETTFTIIKITELILWTAFLIHELIILYKMYKKNGTKKQNTNRKRN